VEVAVDEGAAVAVGVAVEVGMAAIPEGAAAPDLSQGFGGEAMYCPGCLSSVALTRWRVVRSTAMMWPMFDGRSTRSVRRPACHEPKPGGQWAWQAPTAASTVDNGGRETKSGTEQGGDGDG